MREPTNVAVQSDTYGVSFDESGSSLPTKGGKPGREPPHLRDHDSILSRHQRNHALRGKPVSNEFREMPGAEKFGDMAVNGNKAVVGLALEQFGRSGEPKQIEANSVTFIYCGVILARLSETRRVTGRAREQLHSAQSTSCVQKFLRCRRMIRNRTRLSYHPMFFIVFKNHLMAGSLEHLQTAFRPASVTCDRLDQ